MNLHNEYINLFLFSLVGALLFWALARIIFKNFKFELGRGNYVGSWPQFGAVLGASIIFTDNIYSLIFALTAIGGLGALNDAKKISEKVFTPLLLLTFFVFFNNLEGFSGSVFTAAIWCGLIFVCLKLASLVYEMPFILVSTGSLSSLLLLAKHELSNFSESMCLSVLACALIFMVYSSTGKRALAGNAGLAAWGLLTGLISLQGNSEQLIVLSLLIPSMVVIFPPALVSFLLVTSYLGNNLHRKPDRNFSWSLRREQVVVFTGLIFLCLNFLVILVEFDSPAYGYIALGLLLVAALTGFFKTFARKIVDKKNDYTQIQILDSHIDAICLNEVLQKIKKHIADPQRQNLMHIITADSLAVLRSNEDDFFKTVMKRAELVIPDGAGIIWAADFLGQPLPERIPGVSLVTDIASLSAKQKFKLFFLGGKPGIAQKAAENLRNQFSDLEIVGIRHGYFVEGSAEEDEIMQQICQSKADVVFVALGVPRQERFISKFRLTKHKAVALGVGGSFDVISQTLPRAPEWMQRFAIEWLFRLWLEPFRINRIAKIPAFVLRVLRYKWNQS